MENKLIKMEGGCIFQSSKDGYIFFSSPVYSVEHLEKIMGYIDYTSFVRDLKEQKVDIKSIEKKAKDFNISVE